MSDLFSREAVTLMALKAGADITQPESALWLEHLLECSSPPETGPMAEENRRLQRENDLLIRAQMDSDHRSDAVWKLVDESRERRRKVAAKLRKLNRLIRVSPWAKTKLQIAGTLRNLARELNRA